MNSRVLPYYIAVALAAAGLASPVTAEARDVTYGEAQVAAVEQGTAEQVEAEMGSMGGNAEAVATVSQWLGLFDTVRRSLEPNDGFIRSDDEFLLACLFGPENGEVKLPQQYLARVAAPDGAVPDTLYSQLDRELNALWLEINRLAPNVRPVTGMEAEGNVKAAIRRRVRQGAADAVLLGTVMTDESWRVRLSDVGLPISQYRKGYVKYQVPNQPLVICQQIIIERPFYGGTGAESEYTVRLGYLRLQKQV